ncbi:MAG: hypothetical protein JJU29_21820 [Verrucomicrobia bacterium]|nr:hypothetical protein [Verrucomicrobiota bacterium]MCH8514420.1 hypothetical protein [Kiritimatiellia bacterium]
MMCLRRNLGMLPPGRIMLLGCVLLVSAGSLPAEDLHRLAKPPLRVPPDFDRGEAAVAEGLWAEALEFYASQNVENLDPDARDWHAFRLADLTWRHHLSARHRDQGDAEHAHQNLLRMRRELEDAGAEGRLYAEILESLGDFIGRGPGFRRRNEIVREHYMQALDVWETSTETDLARGRFFQLLKKKFSLFDPSASSREYFGWDGVSFPVSRERIEKGIRIAADEERQAWLAYLKALSYFYEQKVEEAEPMLAHLERLGSISEDREWEDDYLHMLALFWDQKGLQVEEMWYRPDYRRAVLASENLLDRFEDGESRWREAAEKRISDITRPVISVQTGEVFSDATFPGVRLTSRNVERITLRIFPMRLDEMLASGKRRPWGNLLELPIDGTDPVWEKEIVLNPHQPHEPHAEQVWLRNRLPLGAYVIQAKSGDVEAREVLLVSNTSILRQTLRDGRLSIWVLDSLTGTPRPDQLVQFFHWGRENEQGKRLRMLPPQTTNALGQALFDQNPDFGYFISISEDARHQAYLPMPYHPRVNPDKGAHRVVVQTDRPLYRHGDTLKWKITVRRHQHSRLETPARERFRMTFYIAKPERMREVIWEGEVRLNEFGTVDGEIPLVEEMSLGEIHLHVRGLNSSADEFTTPVIARLEAYRLADFVVEVDLPSREGASAVFPPDTGISVPIRAMDHHGEPLAGADATVQKGPVQILLEKDLWETGDKAVVVLRTDRPGRHVLFSRETDRVWEQEVHYIEGQIKELHLDMREEDAPNQYLWAHTLEEGVWHHDRVEIFSQDPDQILTVDLSFDRERYRPGEAGTVNIRVSDREGRPVSAEIGLSMVDEAVYALQEDLAEDAWVVFHGQPNPFRVNSLSGFGDRRFTHRPDMDPDLAPPGAPEIEGPPGANMRFWVRSSHSRFAGGRGEVSDEAGFANVQVRHDLRDTLLWHPQIQTDARGEATVPFTMADSLGSWRATARAITRASHVGMRKAETQSHLPLMARLQIPRYLVVGDGAVITGNLRNHTGEPKSVLARLEGTGVVLLNPEDREVTIPAHGRIRVDWRVRAETPGQADFTLRVKGPTHADGIRKSFPVLEHGMARRITQSTRSTASVVRLNPVLPEKRYRQNTRMTVQVSPSLALDVLDALPDLVYDNRPNNAIGLMNKFLPAVIVRKTMVDLGFSAEEIERRIFRDGGRPALQAPRRHRPAEWHSLNALTEEYLESVLNMQLDSGAWRWSSLQIPDSYMSAYILWTLYLARDGGLEIDEKVLENGRRFLQRDLVNHAADPNLQVWLLFALSHAKSPIAPFEKAAMENAVAKRHELSAYGRALLTLAFSNWNLDGAHMMARTLRNGVRMEENPDQSILLEQPPRTPGEGMAAPIAWWGKNRDQRHWHESSVEATAFTLMALLQVQPEHDLIEPAVQWLIRNRRGAGWNNTKDTAIAILALNHYLRQTQSHGSAYEYTLYANGHHISTQSIRPDTLLQIPTHFEVPPHILRDGANEIRVTRTAGPGRLTMSASADFYSTETPIPASGHEIFVKRQYFLQTHSPTLLEDSVTAWRLLNDGDTVESGDRIRVVLTFASANDLNYLHMEDPKPAGFEVPDAQSGSEHFLRPVKEIVARARFGGGEDPELDSPYLEKDQPVHAEFRDEGLVLQVNRMEQGFWEFQYTLRAESPGAFHALPTCAKAVYLPEVRAHAEEIRVRVQDAR